MSETTTAQLMSTEPEFKQRVRELVGRNIVRAREDAGLSQSQLAEALKQTQSVISAWEHGRRKPEDDNLLAIAQALGRDGIDWFYAKHEASAAQ